MPDRIPARLVVGGEITRQQYDRIVQLIEEEGDKGLSETTPESLVCMHDEAPWGQFEELEEYLVDQGIPFNRHTEAKYEYDAVLRIFRPGVVDEEMPANQNGEVTVTASSIQAAIRETTTREELVRRLEELTGGHLPPLPPLKVVDG